ncbi:hypothetical protein WH47_07550, partial [Habropoda laboriosa]
GCACKVPRGMNGNKRLISIPFPSNDETPCVSVPSILIYHVDCDEISRKHDLFFCR